MERGSLTGRTLNGKYAVGRLIGEGGMGQVYEAENLSLQMPVAIKAINPGIKISETGYRRFKQEAIISGKLSGSPNIVQVHDFDHTDDNIPFLVMEMLKGRDVERFLREGSSQEADSSLDEDQTLPSDADEDATLEEVRPLLDGRVGTRLVLNAEGTLAILGGVFAGIQHAHDNGVVHRDLKPSNIFLCLHGDELPIPKVMDFGISKLMDQTDPMTKTGDPFGTLLYMAPEQVRGEAKHADGRLDIYALGAILYRIMGGDVPFRGSGTVPTVMQEIMYKDPRPLDSINPEISPEVAQVVHRALAKKPQDRYQTARDLGAALAAAVGEVEDTILRLVPRRLQADSAPEPEPTLPTPEDFEASHSEYKPAPEAASDGEPQADNPVPPPSVDPISAPLELHQRPGRDVGRQRPRSASGMTVVLALCGVVLAGGLSWVVWSQNPAGRSAPPKETTGPIPAPHPVKPTTVEVTLRGLPGGARVFVNQAEVNGTPLVIGRSGRPQRLEVRAPGYTRYTRAFTPDRDKSVDIRMVRLAKRRPIPASPKITPKRADVTRKKAEPATIKGKTKIVTKKGPARERAEDRREVDNSTLNFDD